MSRIKIIITSLIIVLCFTVGYISYSYTLNAKGEATIANNSGVFFQNVKTSTKDDSSANYIINNNDQTITLNPIFNQSSDVITYDITIINNTSKEIENIDDYITWEVKQDNPSIKYSTNKITSLKVGEKKHIIIKFKTKGSINNYSNEEILVGTIKGK